jgi:DNA-binding MarR family transcriptional regulator
VRAFDDTVVTLVRDNVDLTLRQTAVLLTVVQAEKAQTVRGLAHALNVSKPAVTRAHSQLTAMGMLRVVVDPTDRRSALITATTEGRSLAETMLGRRAA